MIRIAGMNIWDFKANWMSTARSHPMSQSDEWCIALMDRLFGLEVHWLQGQRSFQDTLLTCLWMHAPDAGELAHPAVYVYCLGVIQACILVVGIVLACNCVVPMEEFHFQLGPYQHTGKLLSVVVKLLQNFISTCNNDQIRVRLRRVLEWIAFLQRVESGQGIDLNQLRLVLAQLNPLEAFFPDCSLGIYPQLTNAINIGCVKNGAYSMPFIDAKAAFAKIVHEDIVDVHAGSFPELCRRTIRHRLKSGPIGVAVYFKMMFAGKTLYQLSPPCKSLQEDILHTLCHSTSRQRRLIPKLLVKIDELVLMPRDDSSDVRHLLYLRHCLAGHFVALGFILTLYTRGELAEAYSVWSSIAQSRLRLNSSDSTARIILAICAPHRRPISSFKRTARFNVRWGCCLGSINDGEAIDVVDSTLRPSEYVHLFM